jgi:hypothetical protein
LAGLLIAFAVSGYPKMQRGLGIRPVMAIHWVEDFKNILAHHILALLGMAKNGAKIWWARIFSRSSPSLVFCLVTPCGDSG